ncbi:MAG: 4-hydroxy-tetrahydrodipicolinate reductase [Armatimonadota bacterium]|nr:4-hydroxy-tetrahydrodipicolinate reductase [Armatimonadota bacterium]
MEPIRVAVSGAAGRMGRATVRAVVREADLRLVAAVGRERGVGQDAGLTAGVDALGVRIVAHLADALAARPDVLVEFAPGRQAAAHARAALEAGVRPVVGSTGLPGDELERLGELARARGLGAVVAPNFAVGAVLMMAFARAAAPWLPHAEVIELHHDRKRDAPSGTALATARLIAAARGAAPSAASDEEELAAGARGATVDGVRIHSVRLPGLNAHQAVVFGGPGQTLTIRHDSLSEESFMPGLLLAVRRVRDLDGLVFGLEHLLGLQA